jgi:hypothetical protein
MSGNHFKNDLKRAKESFKLRKNILKEIIISTEKNDQLA